MRSTVLLLWLATGLFGDGALARPDPVAGIEPVADGDFYERGRYSEAKVRLGQLLFFDKILSGNENISCATCHHPTLGTADGLPLSLGEGAKGLGEDRRAVPEQPLLGRVPRNAQALYFLGATEFSSMFHDGRVEHDPNNNWQSGFWSPAREQLPSGLDNVLAVQAMFPVVSDMEMAGHKGENAVATAAALDELDGPEGAWSLLARRLRAIPEYVRLFREAFPAIRDAEDISFVHAANAIAAFEASAFRPDDSPFDRYLRTRDAGQLEPGAWRGMELFYGRAGCSSCHSGKFQTDQQFHNIAMPQIGPGKNDGWDQSYWQATGFMARLEDHGRYRVTHESEDKYRFRTPSLRNVELTGPWGHAGSYDSLEAVVRHHLEPAGALKAYDVTRTELPAVGHVIEKTAVGSQLIYRPVNPARLDDFLSRDTWVMRSPALVNAIAGSSEIVHIDLADAEIGALVEFLEALTDPGSRDRSDVIPDAVPSGLPVED